MARMVYPPLESKSSRLKRDTRTKGVGIDGVALRAFGCRNDMLGRKILSYVEYLWLYNDI